MKSNKLKKRKPRTIWVNEYLGMGLVMVCYESKDAANRAAALGQINCVEFREIIKKGKL